MFAVLGLDAGSSPSGGEAEQQASEKRDGGVEGEHSTNDREIEEDGTARGGEITDENMRAPLSENQTERRTAEGEQQAFRKELADDASPAGAELTPCGWRFRVIGRPTARSRFATLAQAMSSTAPTTTISVRSASRYCERI